MFAHDRLELPANLLPDDVSDLLARLGYRVDRRNVTLALSAAEIPGVIPPPSRATRWTIPRDQLLDVTAAVLRRREFRAAGPSRMQVATLDRFRLPAARLLLQARELASYVPASLRRRIAAEQRDRREAAAARAQQRLAHVEREQQREARIQAADLARLRDFAMLALYAEIRMVATSARFPQLDREVLNSPAFESFLAEWPYPGERPAWWQPQPGALDAAVELVRPWLDGKTRESPDLRHLVPKVDFAQPWPWRAEPADVQR